VALLRRVLYLDALFAALASIGLVAFPGFFLETLLGQPPSPEYAWVRIVGVQALGLSALAVLLARRLEDLWWWSWAYVVVGFGTAAVTTLNALFGLPRGAAAWPWWLAAAFSWLITFGLLRGIALAGTESQPA
jgi:hypothetical protein